MIPQTNIRSVSGKMSNGSLKVTISFYMKDQEEFKRLEDLKASEAPVSIDIKALPVK